MITILGLALSILSLSSMGAEIERVVNQVSTIGTLHDLFLENPKYGLREFTRAIEQFKPDLILTEVRPEYPSAADAAIDGGIEQSLIYAFASTHSVPVIPTDWFDDEFFQLAQSELNKEDPEFVKKIRPMFERYRASLTTASLIDLNSEATQKLIREIYLTQEKAGMRASRIRNERIAKNIREALIKNSGKRVLILYGMDHKYFIDDAVSTIPNNKLLPVSSWFDSGKGRRSGLSKPSKDAALLNLKASEDLLRKRLASGFYPKLWELKLRKKLGQFAKWSKAIQAL